jgi:hypothetical protein
MPHIMYIFRICHWEDPGKAGGSEIKRNTAATGLCWWCESTGKYHGYHNEKHKNFDTTNKVGLDVNAKKTSICCCLSTRVQGKTMTWR